MMAKDAIYAYLNNCSEMCAKEKVSITHLVDFVILGLQLDVGACQQEDAVHLHHHRRPTQVRPWHLRGA